MWILIYLYTNLLLAKNKLYVKKYSYHKQQNWLINLLLFYVVPTAIFQSCKWTKTTPLTSPFLSLSKRSKALCTVQSFPNSISLLFVENSSWNLSRTWFIDCFALNTESAKFQPSSRTNIFLFSTFLYCDKNKEREVSRKICV